MASQEIGADGKARFQVTNAIGFSQEPEKRESQEVCWYKASLPVDRFLAFKSFGARDNVDHETHLSGFASSFVALHERALLRSSARANVAKVFKTRALPDAEAAFDASLGQGVKTVTGEQSRALVDVLSNNDPSQVAPDGLACKTLFPKDAKSEKTEASLSLNGDVLNCRRYNFTQLETDYKQGRPVTYRVTQSYWTAYRGGKPVRVRIIGYTLYQDGKYGAGGSPVDDCLAYGGGFACNKHR